MGAGRFKPHRGKGLLFDSPGSAMSHSPPLGLRSALGEERAFKNSTANLNTSAPCLLQVISNYSADKRVLAQGTWHPRCHSRELGPRSPSPFSQWVSTGLEERDGQIIHARGPAQTIMRTRLATSLHLVSLSNVPHPRFLFILGEQPHISAPCLRSPQVELHPFGM